VTVSGNAVASPAPSARDARPRRRLWSLVAAATLVAVGCVPPQPQALGTPLPSRPQPSPSGQVAAETARPTAPPATGGGEAISETLPRERFGNPSVIDNPWLPLVPGTRTVFDGEVTIDGVRIAHSITSTVTDLVKVIDGIEAVVVYEVDAAAGEVTEAEIAFFAQDDDGTVWLLGEYPEEYEEGVLVDAPTWLSGVQGAAAGIMITSDPKITDPSLSQGFGPAVDFYDRARVFETDSRTCVPLSCYDGILVMNEYNPNEPDAHQLKYYASGIGVVRVGWAGALEQSQEVLQLVERRALSSDELAAIRAEALALEVHAYEISPDTYGQSEPARRR